MPAESFLFTHPLDLFMDHSMEQHFAACPGVLFS